MDLAWIKAVAFQYEPNEAVRPLLESFRMMVNHAMWVGVREGIRGRFTLIRAVYEDFKRYGLHTHYTLSACEVSCAILKNHRRTHRAPVARRFYLKLDNQTYQLRGGMLRIPANPRQFLTLKLKIGKYQRVFLEDSSLRLGSITLTESKLIAAFKQTERRRLDYKSVVAYDTNELSLDGAFSNGVEVKPIHVDLRQVARVRAFHFERRRHVQSRLAHSRRRLKTALADDRDRERRRIEAVLHQVAKKQVSFAKAENGKIVLEDLKGIKRSVNRRVMKRNHTTANFSQSPFTQSL